MIVKDFKVPFGTPSLNYDQKTIALVVKTPEEIGKDNVCGVYIPRLMFGLTVENGAYEEQVTISGNRCKNTINKNLFNKKIKIKNYLNLQVAQACNILTPKFSKGENVFVDLCDHDIKNMYILPYGFGEVNRRKNDMWAVVVPNFSSYKEEPLTLENTYGIQIDTKKKIVSIYTNFEDGKTSSPTEKGNYFLSLNPKDGGILLSDSSKRAIYIGTDDDTILIKNEAKSKIEMIKDEINIEAKTLNIKMSDAINLDAPNLKRKHDNIETKATSDKEEIDNVEAKGNEMKINYSTMELESSSYKSKTSKWAVDSPISGFTKVLTSDSFSIFSNAGNNPLPTAANISNAGIAKMGNPSTPSLGLAKAQPLLIVLNQLAAKIDAIGSAVSCPPTAVTAVVATSPQITSMNSFG